LCDKGTPAPDSAGTVNFKQNILNQSAMNKKVKVFMVIFLLSGVLAKTQEISFGAKLGPNISSGYVKANGKSYSGTNIGVHAGFVADIRINEQFVLQPNLLYSFKRARVKELSGIDISLHTIDVPVTVLYNYKKFFGGVGPNFSVGFIGHYTYHDRKYDLYDKDNEGLFSIKRFEIGLNVLAGYHINDQIFVSANYTPGLNNLFNKATYANSNTKVKTGVIGISVGYVFK